MKPTRKLILILSTVALITATIVFTTNLNASSKTLGQLKQDLAKAEEDYKNNKHLQALTESEIIETNNRISNTQTSIAQGKIDRETLTAEIEKLESDIASKDEEIKEILRYMQVSDGDSAFLEYIFGAEDFTDFIYRTSISEQLTEYNEALITEYNNKITENNNKKEDLVQKEKELAAAILTLEENERKLKQVKSGLAEDEFTIENEIKAQKETIQTYADLGCKDSDTFESCANGMLPPGTAFYRPLEYGSVTNEFGVSLWPYYGYHKGIDVSTIDSGSIPVYSSGTGIVTSVLWQQCGTNIVIVQHKINGNLYTTAYWHLKSVSIKRGDYVTKDTKIGVMGGGAGSGDICSTGSHVHFVMSKGLHDNTNGMHNNLSNPRSIVNFPCYGVRFDNKITAYKC